MEFAAIATPAMHQIERDEIATLTEAYEKAGGCIQRFDVFNNTISSPAPDKVERNQARGICLRWEKGFNHRRINAARKKLERVNDCLVSAEIVAELTGLTASTVNSWKDRCSPYLMKKPVKTDPVRYQLVDVIDWIDWVINTIEKDRA